MNLQVMGIPLTDRPPQDTLTPIVNNRPDCRPPQLEQLIKRKPQDTRQSSQRPVRRRTTTRLKRLLHCRTAQARPDSEFSLVQTSTSHPSLQAPPQLQPRLIAPHCLVTHWLAPAGSRSEQFIFDPANHSEQILGDRELHQQHTTPRSFPCPNSPPFS
jgi:hypothetical protein